MQTKNDIDRQRELHRQKEIQRKEARINRQNQKKVHKDHMQTKNDIDIERQRQRVRRTLGSLKEIIHRFSTDQV